MFYVEVYCTLQWEGFHRWVDAPEEVAYLRNIHRHVFHAKISCSVKELDREVEFLTLKKHAQRTVEAIQVAQETKNWSCEMWAREILMRIPIAIHVEVNEDGENGAIVTRTGGGYNV